MPSSPSLRHLLARLKLAWGQSIRRQLTWSFSLVSLAIVLGSGLLLFSHQRTFLHAQGTQGALNLARTLSFSSVSWVLANDLAGLQEVVRGASATTDLRFAAVLSLRGEVLAATKPEYVGQFFSDAVSQRLLALPPGPQVLLDEANLIDVAMPVKSGDRHIGWVRVELTRVSANGDLRKIATAGLGIVALLVLTIVLVATRLARGLTSGLSRLAGVAEDAEHGRPFLRDDSGRADEIGVLARHLYRMLDTINEEKQATEESEARFRKLVKVVPIPLCYVTRDGVIADFNDRFAQVFRYTHADIPTLDEWWQLAYPDASYRQWVLATWNAAVRAAAASGQDIQPVEYRVTCKNGEVRIMEISGVTLGEDFLATFIDVTARRQAEEVTQAAARYARSLIEASLDPLVTISPDGKITDVNTATERATGAARADLVGSDFADYFTDPEKAREGYRQVFAEGFVTDYPLALRHASGRVADVLYNASVYRDDAGKVLGVFAVARDVTALKRVEAVRTRLAAIVESSDDAIIGKTPDGIITSWNKGAERIYGYSADEIVGKSIALLAPPRCQVEIDQLLKTIRDGGTVTNHETIRIRKDGTPIHVALTLSPIRDASGKLTGISTIARDITEKKRMADELTRYKDHLEDEVQQRTADLVLARDAAEAANRAKSVFLSSISHELRTPLNAILGFSNMMRRDSELPRAERESLDIINRSGEHLLTLINDVLEVAKIEAGRVQLQEAAFDLGGLVRDVTDMMSVRAQEKGLRLLVDQASEFPRYLKGDEARLRQVLINLIGNAVKFTQDGGVTLRLGVQPGIGQGRLSIEVEDTGIGIRGEDQQRIFEPFVQVSDAATQKGTGLGLTLTRQYVQLMGGTISVESVPGEGSTFHVELPLHKVDASEIAEPERAEDREIVGLAPGQPEYRILIAEDQMENRLLLTRLMESLGLPVKVAENGEQALALFQAWQPHLIWMDRRMPVMDGLEATRRIRALPGGKDVKIVAVTASAFVEQRDDILAAGMDEFVRKPYRFHEIYECLGRQLGVRYAYADARETGEAGEATLTAGMLATLPADLREEIHAALISLESPRISAAIDRVASHDPALRKTLSRLADEFNYPAILAALKNNLSTNGT